MEEGGASSHPFMRSKRDFSTMSASHRGDSPSDVARPRDDHYENEHASRRRRIQNQLPHPRTHYPGDGLDFRRPVMSTSVAGLNESNVNGQQMSGSTVIDLTDEDGTEQSQGTESQATGSTSHMSSRAQRLPRFGRDVIDVESSDAEEDYDITNLPGANYLALPTRHARPQYSSLRRPARLPSPPAEMDDVEFIETRPRSRSRLTSRQPTPAATTRLQRSVTPYPTNLSQTIDLTEDNDDDIVHLNTRQREGINADRPTAIAATDMGTLANRGFGHMGHIANLLQEGGANLGGRLMQRLQGIPGFNGEIRAQQQALEHFTHNHIHQQQREDHLRRHHHHHHHHHRQRRPEGAPNRPGGAIRIQQDIAGAMDYAMTGWDMGLVGGGQRPPSPKYSPPPPAETGFTRAPKEDEVVVCPNCGDELAMGGSEIKQEVWVVKGCGHAYCGECAHNRSRPNSKKGKGKAPAFNFDDRFLPPAFKKCVVEGCGKPAAKNSMVHVYLGS